MSSPLKAKCNQCSLGQTKEHTYVPAERHKNDSVVILGDLPSAHDTLEGRPFVGPDGMELQAALDGLGIQRTTCQLNNTICCQVLGGRLDTHLIHLSRRNKKREKAKKATLLTPMAACSARLEADIEGFTKIICLGAKAAASLRGGAVSVLNIRGGCETITKPWGPVQVGYTLHPSFVLRSPKWREVFRNDLKKIFNFFDGKLNWTDPEIKIIKSYRDLKNAFWRFNEANKPIAYDVETDAKNPLKAKLRCVGFSNGDFAIIVPLLSIDGVTEFFSGAEKSHVIHLLQRFLKGTSRHPLLGHNAGQYDRLVCENQLGITPNLASDTLLLHLLADNEMPHNLGFVGSFYTDFVESWKSDHTAVTARTDMELWTYCAKDCAVTIRAAAPLGKVIHKRKQWPLLRLEHDLQDVGCGMQRLGMRVDLDKVHAHRKGFEEKLSMNRNTCKEILGSLFNPNSTHQLRRVLFTEWKLPPVKYNEKTGDPSTDDDTLRRMLTTYGLTEEYNNLIQSVRMVRRYTKLLSTYIKPLSDDDSIVLAGRIHPSYNRLPATGRYSSSAPNAQNIPYYLRDIFIPEEGHIFVGADMDQLELRLIAEEAQAERLIDIIVSGKDPHNETMEIVFGEGIWDLDGAPEDRTDKGDKVFKSTRGITKNVRYAWQYAASVPTIHEQVISVEDGDGALIYAHLTQKDIRNVVYGLKRADPEIPSWWDMIQNKYRTEGFIADTLWGRRRDFRDKEKINELVNHPIQAGGSSIVHEAMLQLVKGQGGLSTRGELPDDFKSDLFKFDFRKRLGLVNQCHDSLVFEVREEDSEEASKLLQGAMNRRRRKGARLTYTAEAEVGQSWLEV